MVSSLPPNHSVKVHTATLLCNDLSRAKSRNNLPFPIVFPWTPWSQRGQDKPRNRAFHVYVMVSACVWGVQGVGGIGFPCKWGSQNAATQAPRRKGRVALPFCQGQGMFRGLLVSGVCMWDKLRVGWLVGGAPCLGTCEMFNAMFNLELKMGRRH